MNIDEIINYSRNELTRIELSDSQKSEILFNIIFINSNEGKTTDLYVDVKKYFELYLSSLDGKKFGYDKVNHIKLQACIELLNPNQRLSIYKFLKKCFIKYNLSDDWNVYVESFHRCRNLLLSDKKYWYFNPKSLLLYIYNKSVYSYSYLVLLVIIVILISYLILLPNPSNVWSSVFEVKYQDLSNNFYINHLDNILLGLFEIDSDFEIMPMNFLGVILLILGKLIKILFVVKYAADKIRKKLIISD